MQASHSHFEAFCWATNDLKPASVVSIFGAAVAAVVTAAPGFFVQQATHSLASFLLRTMQAEHSQVSDLGLKASPKVFFIVGNELVEGKVGFGTAAAGFERGVSHATHFSSVSLFLNIQAEHSHSFAGFLNMSPKLEAADMGVADGGLSEVCFLSASRTLPVLS